MWDANLNIVHITIIALSALFYGSCSFKAHIIQLCSYEFELKAKDKESDSRQDYALYEYGVKKGKKYSTFFFLEGCIIWLCLVAIYCLQNYEVKGLLGSILQTGVYVPIVFILCARLIEITKKCLLKDYDSIDRHNELSVFLMVLTMNICVLFLDWKVFLFIFSLLLGKFIWLDGGIARIKEYINQIINTLKYDSYQGIDGLTIVFVIRLLIDLFIISIGVVGVLMLYLIK